MRLPAFAEAAGVAFRRVEAAERMGRWVAGLSEVEAVTPRRAGCSSPAEVARMMDDSALRALGALGLTPASAARFGRRLADAGRPDLALLVAEAAGDAGEAG